MQLDGTWTIRSNDTTTGLLSFLGFGTNRKFMKNIVPLGSALTIRQGPGGNVVVRLGGTSHQWTADTMDFSQREKITGTVDDGSKTPNYRFEICWRTNPSDGESRRILYGIISPILSPGTGNSDEELGDPGVWDADDSGGDPDC